MAFCLFHNFGIYFEPKIAKSRLSFFSLKLMNVKDNFFVRAIFSSQHENVQQHLGKSLWEISQSQFIWHFTSLHLARPTFRWKLIRYDSGCGSVDRVVASNSRGTRFGSTQWQKFTFNIYYQLFWTDENKEKEAENGPFLKKSIRY